MTRKLATGQVSIANVAALADVSTATVSRVLSGQRDKDDDISRRVKDAAAKLNYSVNFAASSLRSDVTRTIGLMLPEMDDEQTPAHVLNSLSAAIRDAGRYLLLSITADPEQQKEDLRSLLTRGIDGLIVIPENNEDFIASLNAEHKNLPIVQLGGKSLTSHISWVGTDQSEAMRMTVDHLAEQGAHAIAYLSRELESYTAADLFTTFYTQANALDLTPDPNWVQFGPCTMERGYQAAISLFRDRRNVPDAVVCASDSIALGVLIACKQLGLQVPEDVKIIGYGDSPACEQTQPALTSIRPVYEDIAHEAVHIISKWNESMTKMPTYRAFKPELVYRESTWSARTGSSDMTPPGSTNM
ncbi:LacI family DNA-binding transcriptional regulator [Bombiscardovia coagulans]|uniref:LacI family transcriptional regulator n=1 Tax=Bombiscardovia coagulans TaxID=686666 RepID=A0A261EQ32_9BIFI|nr:LacI family DNA-binding transcriptional regulator [Bombiscardovia coagulans]OZG48796.1 LacI family transcriptional regulator [Bombiscardovia coagulans]